MARNNGSIVIFVAAFAMVVLRMPAEAARPTIPVPANLSATATSSGAITLGWIDTDNNETGFVVERSSNATSGFVQIATVGSNTTSYLDGGLAPSTTRYYRVRTLRKNSTSDPSNTAGATTFAAPTNTATATNTAVPPTATRTPTSTSTWTSSPTRTPTNTALPTSTPQPTNTPQPTSTRTNTPLPTNSPSPTNTILPTATFTATATRTNSPLPTNTIAPTATFTATRTNSPSPTSTIPPTATFTATRTSTPSATSTLTSTATHTSAPSTATATATSTPTPTSTPGASSGLPLWARRLGGTTADSGEAIAADPSGNVWVAGFFTGTVDFGGGPVTSSGVDIFVAKYSPANVHLWSTKLGSAGDDRAFAIAADSSGNVFVTGSFQNTVDLGCGPLSSALASTSDIFVVKLSASGACLWSKSFGSGNDDFGYGVAVDAANDVIVTGSYIGNIAFGGARLWGSNNGTGSSTFVAKYAPDGTHLWSKAFSQSTSNNGPDTGYAVAVDASGNAIVTGSFQGTEYFDGVNGVASAGLSEDLYVAKLAAADGSFQWARGFGSTGSDRGYGVAADPNGNVFITGYFAGSVDFGSGVPLASVGPLNAVLAKYSAAGAYVWAKGITGSGVNTGYAVAVDSGGNPIVTGSFQTTTSFAGPVLSSLGRSDVFVAKYSPLGVPLWARGYGGASDDLGSSVAVDGSGNVLAAGYFQGAATFGPLPLTSSGSTDAFVLAIAP